MLSNRILSVKPIINYPSLAQIGQTYLMTIDLQPEEDSDWQLEEEEYPVYCSVNSEVFESRAIGEPIVTLHRFGGSYGAASFLLKAEKSNQDERLVVLFRNKWGALIKSIEIENIRVLAKADKHNITPLIKEKISVNENKNTQRSFLQDISDSLDNSSESKHIADIFIEFGLSTTDIVNQWMQNTYLPANLRVEWEARLSQISTETYTASQRYFDRCLERHGLVRVLGMREVVEIESTYTEVNTFNENPLDAFQTADELENSYQQSSQRLQTQTLKTESGIKVVNKTQFLMILGGPGSGKTTFLRKTLLNILRGQNGDYTHERIPILIELKNLIEDSINLIEYLVKELKICAFPMAQEALEKLLEQGKIVILLDGLDEIASDKLENTVQSLESFIDKYDKNQFIITCRPLVYRRRLKRFQDVTIANFGDDQIRSFIQRWFKSRYDDQGKELGDDLWKVIQSPINVGVKELTHTPIFLIFICLVYDRSRTIPRNRSVLFGKATRILLEEWSAEKRIDRDLIYEHLTVELEEIFLSEVAYKSFSEERLFFSKQKLLEEIESFIRKNITPSGTIQATAVLKAIEDQQGIFVQRAVDVYSFSHLTLQEYFVAQYIADNVLQESIVKEYLTDVRWRDVFLLISGLLSEGNDCDNFLLAIESTLQKYVASSRLNDLIRWAKNITSGARSKYKPSLRRSIAIFVVLSLQYVSDMNSVNKGNFDFSIVQNFYDLSVELNSESGSLLSDIFHSLKNLNQNNSFEFLLSLAQTVQEISVFGSNNNIVALLHALDNISLNHRASEASEQSELLIEQAITVWYNILSFEQTSLVLSEEEKTTLSKYAYGTSLLLKVQKASVRVSRSKWKQIEKRILTSV
ncbi:putative NTPase (NACHT family) [Leptolyngbya sp. PCC 7375]|nr:putative NTPase (NACHT family) [Leptolyngbya sp. PCC 7375]